MKSALVLLAAVVLAGCSRPPVPVFNAERVADGTAESLAGTMWGKVEYAPKQYAGFAYDSTGVYGNLHGVNPPEILSLRFRDSKGLAATTDIRIWLFPRHLMPSAMLPSDSSAILVTPAAALPEGQFKWLGQPLIGKRPSWYGRTFWISWKAMGWDGPPAEGELGVYIQALKRKGTGASFRIATDSTP